jgi:hypothetical protein
VMDVDVDRSRQELEVAAWRWLRHPTLAVQNPRRPSASMEKPQRP